MFSHYNFFIKTFINFNGESYKFVRNIDVKVYVTCHIPASSDCKMSRTYKKHIVREKMLMFFSVCSCSSVCDSINRARHISDCDWSYTDALWTYDQSSTVFARRDLSTSTDREWTVNRVEKYRTKITHTLDLKFMVIFICVFLLVWSFSRYKLKREIFFLMNTLVDLAKYLKYSFENWIKEKWNLRFNDSNIDYLFTNVIFTLKSVCAKHFSTFGQYAISYRHTMSPYLKIYIHISSIIIRYNIIAHTHTNIELRSMNKNVPNKNQNGQNKKLAILELMLLVACGLEYACPHKKNI